MVAAILNFKKMHNFGIFWDSSAFVWGDVQVSFLKKSAFCNFIPGSTLMLLLRPKHYARTPLVLYFQGLLTNKRQSLIQATRTTAQYNYIAFKHPWYYRDALGLTMFPLLRGRLSKSFQLALEKILNWWILYIYNSF